MGIFDDDDVEFAAVYAEEAAMVDASELIAEALERSEISRADLARALGVSRSEITARLAGERNITVRNLAKTLHVLGSRLELKMVRREAAAAKERTRIVDMEQFRSLKRFRSRIDDRGSADRMTENEMRRAMKVAR